MADWSAQLAALQGRIGSDDADGAAIARAARTLANQQLGPLEQIRTAKLAARLWPHRANLPGLRPFRVTLISNATVDFISADLKAAGLARGLLVDVVMPPFGSAMAVAVGGMPFEGGDLDAVVLLLDSTAFRLSGPPLDEAGEAARLDEAGQHIEVLAKGLRERLQAPVIVATVPGRPDDALASADIAQAGSPARLLSQLNARIAAGASSRSWLVWDLAGLAGRVGLDHWFDPVRFHLGKTPFAVEQSALAADHLCRLLAAMAGKTGRALVLDLDNTLWGGVVGDDGLNGLVLGNGSPRGEAFLAIQRLALELRARGVVLAVCSKNTHDVAMKALAEHPDMLLRPEHFATFRINWSDKAGNIREIADALNLGLESIVFVDDNPVERNWVREALPEVAVPELGEDPAWYPRTIVASGLFEHLLLGKDDVGRVATFRPSEPKPSAGDYAAYLDSLEMRMSIAPFDSIGRSRIAQLINKSNQFNLTTRRYNEVAVEALEKDPGVLTLQVRLEDRFADQGMIAVIIVKIADPVWEIDSWLMSCRILERGVEQAILNHLVSRAAARGIRSIRGTYIRTPRNALVEGFFERMTFRPLGAEEDGRRHYELDVDAFQPFETSITSIVDNGPTDL